MYFLSHVLMELKHTSVKDRVLVNEALSSIGVNGLDKAFYAEEIAMKMHCLLKGKSCVSKDYVQRGFSSLQTAEVRQS